MYDPCGRASGSYKATPGKGEFTNTTYAKLGDLGSQVLPKYDTGTVWEAGSIVETMASFRATHGGGYQYRLCPLEANLTEACFQVSGLLVQQVPLVHTNTDYSLPTFYTWIPTTRRPRCHSPATPN